MAAAVAAEPPPAPWREAPGLAAIFAPRGPQAAAYRAYVSPANLDAVLREFASDPSLLRAPGAWTPQDLAPADAFGQGGTYDRSTVARLYGSGRARVARGARVEDERIVESWTLISPYPDPARRRLEPGTLLLIVRLP
ncbi:MAG: hypothetical protein HY824_11215 [Acidobacteria bacterium]|nr:hypothetical protein [Acidobacteriota bacterium]